MITHNLGYPRIGNYRETKKALEAYWSGKIQFEQLVHTGNEIKSKNWLLQKELGLDLIPSNDFSFYDHVLDMILTVGAIPERYSHLSRNTDKEKSDLYFAMARGVQGNDNDITAMEMTKWFDTNYHYIVPEFTKKQEFKLLSVKFLNEFLEAKKLGIITKPVLIGPVSFLLSGKEKEPGFNRINLLEKLMNIYIDIIAMLQSNGAEWIQFDEPFMVMDLSEDQKESYITAYSRIKKEFPGIKIMLATYFGEIRDNIETLVQLPVDSIHLDLAKGPSQLDDILKVLPDDIQLSMGIVDGRNIWKNDYSKSLEIIKKAITMIGKERIMLAPSCSLLHVPCDLESETENNSLFAEVKKWLSFAKQKIGEVVDLSVLTAGIENEMALHIYNNNQQAINTKKDSSFIHNDQVKKNLAMIDIMERLNRNSFIRRKHAQREKLGLPLFPTTTIGSFPQTKEVRALRSKLKKGEISKKEYDNQIKQEIKTVIQWQEDAGLDVLVHGEFERNDMVEYFGEMLNGFVFTKNGWVQSYGSRCVKPPVIFGDISRPKPMTIEWTTYAQSLSSKPVKGMLTGPVTILKWSFARNDQPLSETCMQIALAIREEVLDLEKAGIRIIQIDEPALREGLPLRKADQPEYLKWAIASFRLTSNGVKDETQIHTHMCYSEFSDIIENIKAMDADVITIECSRSQMELLDTFAEVDYPNDIGPGVYDIHSPRIPSGDEMVHLLEKASAVIPPENIWVNPDCGLKTRSWDETKKSIVKMVESAKKLRKSIALN